MIVQNLIEQDILDGPYPENVKDQVSALVNRINELESTLTEIAKVDLGYKTVADGFIARIELARSQLRNQS
jgi:hypothetical protein